jgi:hypothetical protein
MSYFDFIQALKMAQADPRIKGILLITIHIPGLIIDFGSTSKRGEQMTHLGPAQVLISILTHFKAT